MKKISIELQPCLGNRSGVGTYAYELSKRMHDTDEVSFQANIFNFRGRNDNSHSIEGIDYKVKEQIILPYKAYRASQYFLPIPYSTLFGQADINLFFNFIIPAGVKGKAITTIYDMTYMRFPETMKKRNYFRLKSGMEKAITRADKIITISEFSKKEICSLLNVKEENVEVIYCAAPPKIPAVDFNLVSQKFSIQKPFILFVGTIEPRKNLVRLIQAFNELKKNHHIPHMLVLAGGKGWQNEEIYSAAAASDYAEDIVFTGYISAEEKSALYENAAVFAFPSLYEGFGIPPLEAMQCGCPVVTSKAASLPEAAGDAAEYVDAYDVKSIADGIFHLINDYQYATALSQKGYRQVTRFSWDESAEQLLRICREL